VKDSVSEFRIPDLRQEVGDCLIACLICPFADLGDLLPGAGTRPEVPEGVHDGWLADADLSQVA
jgi:hypothetical protein